VLGVLQARLAQGTTQHCGSISRRVDRSQSETTEGTG
jgi:hypothetical protein